LNKESISILLLFTLPLLLFPSCMASQQDILAMNRQIQNLNLRLNKLSALREGQAEVVTEFDSVKLEVQRVLGSLEEHERLIRHTIEKDTIEQDALNARLAELEKKVTQLHEYLHPESLPQEKGTEKAGAGVLPPTPEEKPGSPENKLYETILAIYHEGRYSDAITGFEDFLKSYPKSNLADNAQFWIGEAYMASEKYGHAIQAYQEVVTKFPEGNKVPNAMLKQALAFNEINDPISAKALLKKIVKKYPASSEAEIAEAKLKTIK